MISHLNNQEKGKFCKILQPNRRHTITLRMHPSFTIITILCQILALANALPQLPLHNEQTSGLTKRVPLQVGSPNGIFCDLSKVAPDAVWTDATFFSSDNSKKARDISNAEPYLESRADTDSCNVVGVARVTNFDALLGKSSDTKVLQSGQEYELGFGFSRPVAKVSVLYESGDFADNDDNGEENIKSHRHLKNPGTNGTISFLIKTPTAIWFEVDFGNSNPGTDVALVLYQTGS